MCKFKEKNLYKMVAVKFQSIQIILLLFTLGLFFNSCEGLDISEKEHCERTAPDPTCGIRSWYCSPPREDSSLADKQRYAECQNALNNRCLLEEISKHNHCKNKSKGTSSLFMKNPKKALSYDSETDDSDTSGL